MPLEMGDIRSGIILTQLVRLADDIRTAARKQYRGGKDADLQMMISTTEYDKLRSSLPKKI